MYVLAVVSCGGELDAGGEQRPRIGGGASERESGLTCVNQFDPVWAQGPGANEWWVDFSISGGTITAASLQVVGGTTVTLHADFGRWVGSSPVLITTGTNVFLSATNDVGETARTNIFAYLVNLAPVTQCAGECVPECGGAVCGDDGCGGTCGSCGANETCVSGLCAGTIESDAGPGGLPADFERTVYASGLTSPTAMAFSPDGRLFVCERAGRLRVIKNGVLLAQPFLTVPVVTDGERGLVGVAIDPNFATNRYLYIYYTYTGGTTHTGVTRISRFTASPTNPDVAAAGSELILMGDIPNHTFHNSGAMHFGTDGMLYFAVGDNTLRSQVMSTSSLLGKINRINPAAYPNLIPPDNPFVGVEGARGEVWAMGLRNPFTFAIDPTNGQIFANDVGEDSWEEVDEVTKASNNGWPVCEGNFLLGSNTPCNNPSYKNPLFAYSHSSAFPLSGCSTIGGAFYRGSQFPAEYQGSYFFTDYCERWLARRLPSGEVRIFSDNVETLTTSLIQGPDGAIYYGNIRLGQVFRIAYVGTANRAPTARASASPTEGPLPLTVSFDGSGSSDPDGDTLSYAWTFGDGTSGTGATVTHTYTSGGTFVAQLSVSDGAASAQTSITITAGPRPTAVITAPDHYSAGDTLAFSGTAESATGQPLPASAFSWTILFHHDEHTHPFLGPLDGVTSGSATIPTTGELSANVFFRIELTVTDGGVSTTVTHDVFPNTATITLQTSPPGLTVLLDSATGTTPRSIVGVTGIERQLSAPSPQVLGGVTYQFASWSDGGQQTHTISTPGVDTTYTANFVQAPSSAEDHIIYGDTLAWNNWSWRTTVNTSATSPVLVGTRSMAVTYTNGWAGLSFQRTNFDTTPYSHLRFAIRPSGSLPRITATFHTPNNAEIRKIDIRPYASPLGAGWLLVNIPLTDLGAANTTVSRVSLQEGTGTGQPTFFIDDIRMVARSSTPPPPPPPAQFLVYADTLQWQNWSWNTTLNFAATSPVFNGIRSMAVTYTQRWGGVSLQNAGLDTTPYTHVVFAINPGANPVPALNASLYDTADNLIRQVRIGAFVTPAANGWFTVAIPLSELGGAGRTVTRLQIQDAGTAVPPTFYIDDVGFVAR